jgi:hypothetical protein
MDREALELFAHGAGGRAQAAVRAPHLATQQFKGAATLRWILQQLHSKTVLAHIGAFPNKCTIKHPFHT